MGAPGERRLTQIAVAKHSETKELVDILATADGPPTLRRSGALGVETWIEDRDGALSRSGLRGTWRHFKGAEYRFLGRAVDEETSEPFVVYLDAELTAWVRPERMIEEHIERAGYSGPRFWKLS